MKRVIAMAFLAPLALALALNLGCGGGKEGAGTGGGGTVTKGGKEDGGSKAGAGGLVGKAAGGAIDVKETGTVKGKVTFDGTPPVSAELKIDPSNKDKAHCMAAGASADEKTDPTWRVAADGGVANVVVWVRAPNKGSFFKLAENLRKPDRQLVTIDQPHCAFIPHVDVMFPNYFTEAKGKPEPTGQRIKILNSAEITHNTKYTPNDSLVNPSGNPIIEKTKEIEIPPVVSSDKPGREGKYILNCSIHPWMNAHVWMFDHPFAKVTGKDGTFEFKVPADTDVDLVYWHESMTAPKVLKSIRVPAGKDVTENIKVTK